MMFYLCNTSKLQTILNTLYYNCITPVSFSRQPTIKKKNGENRTNYVYEDWGLSHRNYFFPRI